MPSQDVPPPAQLGGAQPAVGLPIGASAQVDTKGLGRLIAVSDIRSIWPNEAGDFTPWLFENLDLLGEALGLPLTGEQTEYPVGPYRLDILAADPAGRRVAIENQVEAADHSHLGQLLLYAAHVNADTAVWVSPRFRDEQRQALLWLNENTLDGVRFFGVELGVVCIAGSPPAPVFNVVVRPNDLQKAEGGAPPGEMSDANIARREFFDDVLARVSTDIQGFRKPSGSSYQGYVTFRSGPFGYFSLTFTREHRLRAEVYLDSGDAKRNKALFDELATARDRWEQSLGFTLEWDRLNDAKASRLARYLDFWLPGGEDQAEAAAEWATQTTVALISTFESTLRSRAQALRAPDVVTTTGGTGSSLKQGSAETSMETDKPTL
jgi:hypothetical protein